MKENTDLVSVVISVYNVQKYLKTCIKSVINQSYKNLEIIIVNDGSPDNSLNIIKEYSEIDSRIVLIDKKNEGVSAARNDGIKKAKGKYIFFLDGDDFLDKDFFKYFTENAKENKSDVVILNSFWSLKNRVCEKYHSALPTCSLFIKKRLLDEYDFIRYPLNIQPGEDGIFSHILLMHAKKISFEDKVIYHYVKHEGQDHTRALKEPKILLTAIKKWLDILNDFYAKHCMYEKYALSFMKYIEGEAFLAFKTKPFSKEDETAVFNTIKNTADNLIKYLKEADYKYFSKEFNEFLKSKTIKEYYSVIKYRYNYLRFKLFFIMPVSIRYKENRIKLYK